MKEELKLENQLCFPLYAASREIIRKYTPHLDKIGLTYTQYVAMMVFWQKGAVSAKELGKTLYLDSGTLTPVLKSLEKKGYIRRFRGDDDQRVLFAEPTDEGRKLEEQAADIPHKVAQCIPLPPQEAATLYTLLYKMLETM